jgi:hypothetical protein
MRLVTKQSAKAREFYFVGKGIEEAFCGGVELYRYVPKEKLEGPVNIKRGSSRDPRAISTS